MATCPVCHGLCETPTGRYHNCYSCGGRGYGSSTDVPCVACGGSGTSTQEIMDPCYHCHGTGIVDNSTTSSGNRPPTSPAAKQSTRAGVKPGSESRGATSNKPQVSPKTTAKEKPDGLFALLAAVFAGIMGYTHFEQTQNSTESLLMGAVCFVAGYAGLFVLYYVVKLAIELLKVLFVVVFWGGVALVVGNLLGIQLAADIIDFLETLWRNISSTL